MKPQWLICKGCWIQMRMPVPLHGPLAIPFRLFGVKPSRMNPNLCTICETMFRRVKKRAQIQVPATVLFADVRGYTTFSELLDSPEIANLLSDFYEECAGAIWEQDGLINKLIGDAVLAIFNFPIEREDHILAAVTAGMELQRRCREMKLGLKVDSVNRMDVGVGVGIHTGEISIGEVGNACRDFTAIGKVVNLASRLQSVAKTGEVLVTDEVYQHVRDRFPETEGHQYRLKGIDRPVNGHVLL